MSNPENNQPQEDPSKTVEDALRKAASDDEARTELEPEDAESAEDTPKSPSAEELEAAKAEAEKFRDVALRAEAEMQNVRRRAEQDVEKAHKFGQEKLVSDLLPVIDSLEKAIESAQHAEGSEAVSAIIEGMTLCHKMFVDTLSKQGGEVVDPEGEPFDPNLHQAISTVENGDVEPKTVLTVVQKGYTLNGRLVRPAMVMVSKAPA